MKATKKILCAVFALVLALSALTACSGNSGKSGYTANNTEFFIGATGPLTGDASAYGISVQKGATLAIEQLNANGGLNDVKFKFDMIDDQAEAAPAATGYASLYEAGMQISLGSVTSASCLSFAGCAKEDRVLFMTPSASAANVIEASDTGFRVCFGDPQQSQIAAQKLIDEGFKKIGVIYDTSDTYSSGLYEAFEEKMTELGKTKGTDYVVYTFDKENNKDFSAQVTGIKEAGCDIFFLPFYYTEAALVAKKAASIGYNVPIFGCDGLDNIDGQLVGDTSVTAEIRYITPFDVNSTDAVVADFVKAFEAKYNEKPDQFAADGYDAVMILFELMKKAGVSDPTISSEELTSLVLPLLTGDFTFTGVTGKNMSWDSTGSCNKDPLIVTVKR